jgi:dienelactone hydrolase
MDADLSYAALSLGRPLRGMRVQDALSALAYLRTRPDVDPARICLSGRGWSGLIAVFAAAIDPGSVGAAAEGVPVSYAEILGTETARRALAAVARAYGAIVETRRTGRTNRG